VNDEIFPTDHSKTISLDFLKIFYVSTALVDKRELRFSSRQTLTFGPVVTHPGIVCCRQLWPNSFARGIKMVFLFHKTTKNIGLISIRMLLIHWQI
jgi:hypothetical protein